MSCTFSRLFKYQNTSEHQKKNINNLIKKPEMRGMSPYTLRLCKSKFTIFKILDLKILIFLYLHKVNLLVTYKIK